MFRAWSNIDSSNAHILPSDVELTEHTHSPMSPYARSDEIQDERLSGSDFSPCLNNATYIDPKESFTDPERRNGRSKSERFELYNRGNHNGKWTIDETAKRDQDDWQFCRSLTSQMGLSEREQLLTWRAFKRMDMRTYDSMESRESNGMMKQYLVAFCVGVLIYNREHREYEWTDGAWDYYPTSTPDKKSRRYCGPEMRYEADQQGDEGDRHRTIETCAEQLGFSQEQLVRCIEKVRPTVEMRAAS